MLGVTYVVGDATQPKADGRKIIAHVCNDIGLWGRGFVLAISKRWSQPEAVFRQNSPMNLGQVDFVEVQSELVVANMCAQKGVRGRNNPKPLQYEHLEHCLKKVASFAKKHKATVHMPRIGAGLAGGSWDKIKPILEGTLVNSGVEVFVYDFSR